MTPGRDATRGRPRTKAQPVSPGEARALHDAGVQGVPPFVALTGRALPSRAFDPAPLPPLPIRLGTSRGMIYDKSTGWIVS